MIQKICEIYPGMYNKLTKMSNKQVAAIYGRLLNQHKLYK